MCPCSTIRPCWVASEKTSSCPRRGAALAARACLASVEEHLEVDWEVAGVVKALGFVRCTSTFERLPEVLDGASEVLVAASASAAPMSARSAIGVASLPGGHAVELELVLALAQRAT